jgi:hypothetical protein
MKQVSKKTIAKYEDIRDNRKVITENEIRAYKSFLGRMSNEDAFQREPKDVEEYRLFAPKKITKEQSEKGLNWLRTNLFCKDGTERRANRLNLSMFEKMALIKMLKNFKEWRLMGFTNCSQNSYAFYVPIYRMIGKSGEVLEYSVSGQGVIMHITSNM